MWHLSSDMMQIDVTISSSKYISINLSWVRASGSFQNPSDLWLTLQVGRIYMISQLYVRRKNFNGVLIRDAMQRHVVRRRASTLDSQCTHYMMYGRDTFAVHVVNCVGILQIRRIEDHLTTINSELNRLRHVELLDGRSETRWHTQTSIRRYRVLNDAVVPAWSFFNSVWSYINRARCIVRTDRLFEIVKLTIYSSQCEPTTRFRGYIGEIRFWVAASPYSNLL